MCMLYKFFKISVVIFIRKLIYMYSMKFVFCIVLYEKKIVLKEFVYFYIDLKKKEDIFIYMVKMN